MFMLQAEIQYDYLRERLQKMGLSGRAKDEATDWFNELQAKNHLGELNIRPAVATSRNMARSILNS